MAGNRGCGYARVGRTTAVVTGVFTGAIAERQPPGARGFDVVMKPPGGRKPEARE